MYVLILPGHLDEFADAVDHSFDPFILKWCKGHATEQHVLDGVTTEQLRRANHAADHYADRAVEIDIDR